MKKETATQRLTALAETKGMTLWYRPLSGFFVVEKLTINGDGTTTTVSRRIGSTAAQAEKWLNSQAGDADMLLIMAAACWMALIMLVGGLWLDGTLGF